LFKKKRKSDPETSDSEDPPKESDRFNTAQISPIGSDSYDVNTPAFASSYIPQSVEENKKCYVRHYTEVS
jgi:hypothetical protein